MMRAAPCSMEFFPLCLMMKLVRNRKTGKVESFSKVMPETVNRLINGFKVIKGMYEMALAMRDCSPMPGHQPCQPDGQIDTILDELRNSDNRCARLLSNVRADILTEYSVKARAAPVTLPVRNGGSNHKELLRCERQLCARYHNHENKHKGAPTCIASLSLKGKPDHGGKMFPRYNYYFGGKKTPFGTKAPKEMGEDDSVGRRGGSGGVNAQSNFYMGGISLNRAGNTEDLGEGVGRRGGGGGTPTGNFMWRLGISLNRAGNTEGSESDEAN